MSTTLTPTPLSDSEFDAVTSQVLAGIEAQLDAWLEDDVVDIDASRTGGLLEMSFPGGSKIVINTQPPLHELWLAARQGGYHFRFVDGQWRDTKTAVEFFEQLSACASAQAHQRLTFAP